MSSAMCDTQTFLKHCLSSTQKRIKNYWSKIEEINRLWYEPSIPISWSISLCNNCTTKSLLLSLLDIGFVLKKKIAKMKKHIFMSVCILHMCVCICGHASRYKNGGRGEERGRKKRRVWRCVFIPFVYSWALLTCKV